MANTSSHARAVYKQNTAVLYYEPSESVDDAPVSTARIVSAGATHAARSGATLQLVDGMLQGEGQEGAYAQPPQPRVVEVEPPRAAARKRAQRPTRVIAYNVRIVAEGEEQVVDEGVPPYVEADALDDQFPGVRAHAGARARTHHEMEFEIPNVRNRAQPIPQNAQFEREPAHAQMRHRAPDAHFERPDQMPGQRHAHMPFPTPEHVQRGMRMPHSPNPGAVPMSLFGALEGIGSRSRAAAAGSYKQLLAQHLNAGRGPLLSNRNMCLAVGAYAFILLLLALFTG